MTPAPALAPTGEAAMLASLAEATAHLTKEDLAEVMRIGDELDEAEFWLTLFEPQTEKSNECWMAISLLSERLASILPAHSYAGSEPRLNAVLASIAAMDPLRAWALIGRYRQDDLDAESRGKLVGFDAEATAVYDGIRRGGAVSFVSVPENA